MKTVLELNKWANEHTNIGVDALRVLLGAFLSYKGFYLLNNPEESTKVLWSLPGLGGTDLLMITSIASYIHIVGGILIALGLFTRLSILVQLPMVTTALFVNMSAGMIENNLLQASLTFIACLCFFFYGSGRHSLDYVFKLQLK
ncbi:MAG TPA: DoxX family protein [Bacteroidia bacterium]